MNYLFKSGYLLRIIKYNTVKEYKIVFINNNSQ